MVRIQIAAQLLFAAVSLAGYQPDVIPGAYILELDETQDSSSVMGILETDGDVRMTFDSPLFKGVSVQLKDVENSETTVRKLSKSAATKKMWPITLHKRPDITVHWTGNDTTSFHASVPANKTSTPYSPHAMTQVDKLRAKGITGKGIKIAIIDTGIDYNHPALGGCFGEGCLVTSGHDFVGDDYTGRNDPIPDEDPMDCDGHGSHLAGIIAAQNNTLGFTGAAPGVTLAAYRVFGCYGSAADDLLLSAFTRAYDDGVDIVSLSLGSSVGWSEYPWSTVVSRFVENGVPCVVAAGNDGDTGVFFASSPSDGKDTTAVAATWNTKTPLFMRYSTYKANGSETDFVYRVPYRIPLEGSLPVWALSLDTNVTNDGCEPFPDDTPDLSQHLVLLREGGCTFGEKSANAVAKNATGVAMYHNTTGVPDIPYDLQWNVDSNLVLMADTGKDWIELLKAGKEVVVNFPSADAQVNTLLEIENSRDGGAVTHFSSWGPNWELDLKPSFGAPGGNILSTYPLRKGAYAVVSGTSMSTPLTSAIHALLGEVRGTLDPKLLQSLLASTANPQLFHDGTDFHPFLAPVPQQGAGSIQAYDAAYTTTLLEPPSLSFNDTDYLAKSLNFTLTNQDKERAATYQISYVSSRTVLTLNETGAVGVFPNEMVESPAKLTFSTSSVTLQPGKSATIDVVATEPDADASRLPLWSGWITVNGTDGSSLSLPYQGVKGSLHDTPIMGADEGAWISRFDIKYYAPIANSTTFNVPPKGTADLSYDGMNVPLLITKYKLGTRLVRAELVPFGNGEETNESIGQHSQFPATWQQRTRHVIDWGGFLDSKEYAPEGTYRFRVKALRLRGDENVEADWDVSWTQVFSITYQTGE